MRRTILLAVWAVICLGVYLFVNCSDPLDSIDQDGWDPIGPITDVDTIIEYDTVTVTDTVTYVDTLIIYEPQPGDPQTVCSIILDNLREVIWMFRNDEGTYRLLFEAAAAREFTFRTLMVDIDGQFFEWNPSKDPEFTRELPVSQNATIRILADQPMLLGHQVDVCLTISIP
ncbi:MAG: hypothetical protein JSW34_00775 [Candidatus Zixiibacteriota bacterium]|nr:MAG: hypothetical protein JSW34_00775 [candidate division Zixibacteria bacterium]